MVHARSLRLAALALLLVALSMSTAQVVPSVSTDPLGGSTFTTPFFSVTPTYTITTTFPNAGSTTPTVISGTAGPSPATGAFSFSYNAPVSSLTGVEPTEVFSSLAANGEPTVYTSPFQANPDGLQIVDGASSLNTAPLLTFGAMTFACLLGAVWVL